MYEHRKQPVASSKAFYVRMVNHLAVVILLICLSLFMGICGYHYIGGLAWIDAFLDASMILSGMGPVSPLTTNHAKIFAGCYALYSGLLFISLIAIILIPVWHRMLHKFHISEQ